MIKIKAWSTLPEKPLSLRQGELHLWLINLDTPLENSEGYLSGDEQNRADAMLNSSGSRRFTSARAYMRRILGNYLTTDAATIRFQYGPIGKPEITWPETDLCFNLSHSGPLALLALTRNAEIGIDIEPLKPRSSLLAIARKLFGEETRGSLAALPESQRTEHFFQLWTTLEARVKCKGNGVFSPSDNTIPAVNFEPESGWIGAVAISRGVPIASNWRTYRMTSAE
ncbi:MAG: 4'-phosphopantetheinyl transferase superfamily protein [Gammaproteobacteria bacterium]|nr:4'-phosphopantetheinyl transferase superfamily protein [Gammaproteobacteria bacterium]